LLEAAEGFSYAPVCNRMEAQIRKLARRHLPGAIRKPLGTLAGKFHHNVICFFQGLFFDCLIRRFRADGCEFEIPKHLTSVAYRACFLNNSYQAAKLD
jgi:hypothetical protein